ncbi:hypothetical protein Cni_G20852 [Canna indica]|uniref:Uncharacterized protein n=1 Tax=Canna indica TaxID=4628 RepID=A0AAQ3QJU2_9LILI|nr:hypothetical protein Cni_G20852 [Canna indica]
MDQAASETLPEEPTEEEFCLALRNGLILCNVLNQVNPGAVPKVVESPVIAAQSIDGAAQSAIQYFENMRNFLVAVGGMKLLTFEASDLEKGGSSVKVVDCILCLKGYHEWKVAGGVGVWRYGGIVKITTLSRGLPSSFLGGGSFDESVDDCNLQNNQQLSEFLHLVSEATLEDSKSSDVLSNLFVQFGIQLLKACFAECSDAEEFPMEEMLIDLVLEQAVKEFHLCLASQKNKLGLSLKKAMKGENGNMTRSYFMEALLKFLKENTRDSSFSSKVYFQSGTPNEDKDEKLYNQQKQLESGPDLTAEETWGVNYRALNDLFQISQSRQGIISYDVSVQMIEIYNEQVRDLLVADGSNRRYPSYYVPGMILNNVLITFLSYIRNYSQLNGLNIPDASLVAVKCTQDVLELMKVGQGNRAVGATALNERSSRSHSILTIHVQGKELASGSKLKGCLHLVDLAGSERVDKSEATGDRLKEAQHINRSLSALGDVISALAQKSSHIPYRNSKLTQVLQDALGGRAKTLMFVHINPEVNAFGETISTLKFAERVASIELGAAQVNKEAGQVIELKEELSKLRTALESKESEIKQLKTLIRQTTFEPQKTGTKSPSELSIKKIAEFSQQTKGEAKKFEPRSCSSVKQRNPLRSSIFTGKEINAKSLFSAGESCESRNVKSPSPPVRRSISTDRAAIMRQKTKNENLDERTPLKLQFLEKTPVNKSKATLSTELTNESISKCWDPQEIGNLRRVNPEQGDKQFKPGFYSRYGENMKIKAENKPKVKSEDSMRLQTSDTDSKKSETSEAENDCKLLESVHDCNQKLKKFQYNTARISPIVKQRASALAEEPLSNGKHGNKPPNLAAQLRFSKAFPHGKFTLS